MRVPSLLKERSCGECGRFCRVVTSSGLAGFLIDQIWTSPREAPPSESEL
jgi:hypothetical protein